LGRTKPRELFRGCMQFNFGCSHRFHILYCIISSQPYQEENSDERTNV
jgi:hypothetical protein